MAENEARFAFAIPPQRLEAALTAFSDQSGVSISFEDNILDEERLAHLIGTFPVGEGLERLLRHTAYRAEPVGPRLYRIATAPAPVPAAPSPPPLPVPDAVPNIIAPLTTETITVSARRRDELAARLPLSVVVLGETVLNRRDSQELQDISAFVPNLVNRPAIVTPANSPVIRGFISDPGNEGRSPRVVIFHDGIYSGRSLSVDLDLLAVDHVEVLRGPQGTFYGRNTFAGSINVVTKKPVFSWDGHASLQYGNYDHVNARSMVNVPLGDRAAIRIEGLYTDNSGFGENRLTGDPINDEERYVLEAQFRFKPDDRTDVILAGRYFRLDGLPDFPVPTRGLGALEPDNRFDLQLDPIPDYTRWVWRSWMILERDLGGGTQLRATLGYIQAEHSALGADVTPFPIILTEADDREESVAADVSISAALGSWGSVVGGFFYLWETSENSQTLKNGRFGIPLDLAQQERVETNALAPYLHVDVYLGPALTVDAGIRYTHERKSLLFSRRSEPVAPSIDGLRARRTDGQWLPTFGIEWSPADRLSLFTRVSRGVSNGGWSANLLEPEDSLEYGAESVWSYEAGIKGDFWDGALSVELIGFNMVSKNYLVLQERPGVIPNTVTAEETNAGRVRSRGIEAMITWQPDATWQLKLSLGHADAKFLVFEDGGGLGIDFSGNELPSAPQWTLNASAAKTLQVGNLGTLELYGEFAYQDASFSDPSNDPMLRTGATYLINASVAFTPDRGNWRIAFFGENLTNHANIGEVNSGILQDFLTFYGRPRTYRAEIQVRF